MSAQPMTPPPPPPPPVRWAGHELDEPGAEDELLLKRSSFPAYTDAVGDGSCFWLTNPLATLLACVTAPLLCTPLCGAPIVVNPREEAVVTVFGRYYKRLKVPGLYWVNPCGREVRVVSTQNTAHELQAAKCADGNGNPLHISGVVTWRVVDSAKAALDVSNVPVYLSKQAHAVLKRVASMYPYEAPHGTPSLKSEVHTLQRDMCRLLQDRVECAGLEVLEYALCDLAYAPEIAPAMLVRQQAQALVDARTTIVAGAVQIAAGASESIASRGITMSDTERAKLINNLLTVTCGEARVQAVLPVNLPGEGGSWQ